MVDALYDQIGVDYAGTRRADPRIAAKIAAALGNAASILNVRAGQREMARVARHRVLLLNADPSHASDFWLTRDYLPGFADLIPEQYRRKGRWREELSPAHTEVADAMDQLQQDLEDGSWATPICLICVSLMPAFAWPSPTWASRDRRARSRKHKYSEAIPG